MYYDGEWGTICNFSWNYTRFQNANVACRSLGYYYGEPRIVAPGKETQKIILVHLQCLTGYESSLLDCSHSELGMALSVQNIP